MKFRSGYYDILAVQTTLDLSQMGQCCGTPSQVSPDLTPKLEHSKESVLEVPSQVGIPDVDNPIGCGHNEDIRVGSFSWNHDEVVTLDTSVYESNVRLEAIG
jgi:hypothetical protein